MMTLTNLSTIEGTLTPRAPFDFQKTLMFLDYFSPTGGEQAVAPTSMTKAVTLNGRAVAFELHNTGTIEEPSITYKLYSQQPLSDAEHEAIRDRIRFYLSLDDDLQAFYAIGLADPHFAPVIKQLDGLHQPKFLTPFENACWAILAQRNPMAIAQRTKLKIVERWGTSITLPDGTTYQAFPEPEQLAAVKADDLEAVVRNSRKVEYLQAVIQFFSTVDEHYLRTGNYEEVAAKIRGIRGIGEWSSFFILIRGLGRVEHTDANGKEQLKAASAVYKQDLKPSDVQQILDRYGQWQGHWAFYVRNYRLGR